MPVALTPSPELFADAAADRISVSVILPVVDETESLRTTVDTLMAGSAGEIHEILIVTCAATTPAARCVCSMLADGLPGLVKVREQVRPRLGGAMRDAFEWAMGSHVLMMASDLETDPRAVPSMIDAARSGADVVTATRWAGAHAFTGYNPLKFVLNWIFQRVFAAVYGTNLSDLTFGYRLFRIEWVRNIAWQECGHPFLLETILKPLRLGATVVEVPTGWRARTEGESHNSFWRTFLYLGIALRVRIAGRASLQVTHT